VLNPYGHAAAEGRQRCRVPLGIPPLREASMGCSTFFFWAKTCGDKNVRRQGKRANVRQCAPPSIFLGGAKIPHDLFIFAPERIFWGAFWRASLASTTGKICAIASESRAKCSKAHIYLCRALQTLAWVRELAGELVALYAISAG